MKAFISRITNDKGTMKSYAVRIAICLAVAISLAFLAELVLNRRLLRLDPTQKGMRQVEVAQEEEGVYSLSFERQYVNKLRFSYIADGSMTAEIGVNTAETGQDEDIVSLTDVNNQYIRTSIIRIGTQTDKLYIRVPGETRVTAAYLDNQMRLNWRRMMAVMTGAFLLLFVLCFSTIIKERPEVAFVVAALGMGIAYIAVMPVQKNAWDECIHFSNAYRATPESNIGISDIIAVYSDDTKVWPLNPPTSMEEYEELDAYLDANATYDKSQDGAQTVRYLQFKPTNIGYLASGLGLAIGRLFKLPFSDLYRLGKLFNLILYIAVVYFAIKRAVIGKRIMLVIALMPTLMMTAVSYSRDATLNAFALLGMSYILSVFAEEDGQISWKDYLVFAISIYIVSAIKAIYAPLLLLILLIPKERFKDKKTRYIMKFGVLVIALLLVATFVLPVLLSTTAGGGSGEIAGDSRGGNTSVTKQLQFIFANIFTYAKMLLLSIQKNILDYTMGAGALGEVGHWGPIPSTNWLLLTMAVVVMTDRNQKNLKLIYKVAIVGLSFVIACFVWTSMYLSFTEVGSPVIAGVQGRYFVPLVYPLMLVLNSGKLKVDYNRRWYNSAVLLNMIFLQYVALYDMVIRNYCA